MPVVTETRPEAGLEAFADQIKRSALLLDIETAIAHERMAMPQELYGTIEFTRAIGWYKQKTHLYLTRGTLPEPIAYIGNRPVWTRNQVYKFALENDIEFHEQPKKQK